MQELLVLGLIPGTDIQITFSMWLTIGYILLATISTIWVLRSSFIREMLITIVVMRRLHKLQNI